MIAHSKMTRGLMIAIAAVLLAGAGGLSPAAAGSDSDYRTITDKWVFYVGTYLTDFKTDASVGAGGAFGTFLRLEDELGVDEDKSVARLEGFYRFNERHAIGFGFWSLNRDGFTTINEQIEFDGNIFDIGVELTSQFDTSWFRVDWRYSLLRTERGEAGIRAGLSSYQFDIGLAGMATVDDGMGGTMLTQVRAEDDFLAPLPTVGMFLSYAFKTRLVLHLNADFMNIEAADIEGRLVDTTILFEWYFTKNFGIGVGTNTTDIEVKDTGDDPFSVDYRQSGFLGYLTFAFGG